MSNLLNLRNLREFNPQRAAGTDKREAKNVAQPLNNIV